MAGESRFEIRLKKSCSNVNLIAEKSSNTAIGFFVSKWEIKI